MFTEVRSVRAPEESARAFVYRVLALYIREMFLHPGEKLAETDVAQALRVSRTPVHDTFARLERENMLRSVPRGAVVPPLNCDAVRQVIWMRRTAGTAVLGELYNHRPATLEPLERAVAAEYEALNGGSLVMLARLHSEFNQTLYRLAGRLPVLAAMEHTSIDLYRLLRLVEDARLWNYIVGRHAALVQALAMRDHEGAVRALDEEADLYTPLLDRCRARQPYFFE